MNQAVIFDMDGVISDTQALHAEAESVILQGYGISMPPEEITERYAGVSDSVMFEEIFNDHGIKVESVRQVVFDKWNVMGQIAKDDIQSIPYAKQLIGELHTAGFSLAVASASTGRFIRHVLSALALQSYFSALVSSDEVANGKPAPDIFLLAANRLGVKPEDSVVIEDGRSGMQGAKAAGAKCVGLVASLDGEYPANLLVTSLGSLSPDIIRNIK